MTEDQSEYALVVSFPDESSSFVHGFQAGGIWECMSRADPVIERTINLSNEEVLRRMARSEGYAMKWTPLDTHWAECVLTKVTTAKEPGDPIAQGRMSVIEGGRA